MSQLELTRGRGAGRWRFSNRARRGCIRGDCQNRATPRKKKNDSNKEVLMLVFGSNTNYTIFNYKISIACFDRCGNLGEVIGNGKYWKPINIDPTDYKPTYNKLKHIIEANMMAAVKDRRSNIFKINRDKPNMYAYIFSKLGAKSKKEVKQDNDIFI